MLDPIFCPLSLGSLTVPNRIVMAPMTRGFCPDQVPTLDVADYYRRRAENAVGLIITEGTVIHRSGACNDRSVPRFWGEDALAGWKVVVDEVHAAGGKIAPQLWHVGAVRGLDGSLPGGKIDSPSGLEGPGVAVGEPMADNDIADTVAAFANAAASAKALGFDAVELHGAHGYLIDQFFWETLNRRTDRFAGSLRARSEFAVELVKAVRAATAPDFPILMRISQWKPQDYEARMVRTPEELEEWVGPLADAGVDCFDCSQRRFWEPEFDGSELNLAGWVKSVTGKPTITVGSVGLEGELMSSFAGEVSAPTSIDAVVGRLERGEFDLIAVGRALLGDHEWVSKIRDGRSDELSAFDPISRETLY